MRQPRTRLGGYKERIAFWSITLTSDSMGGSTEATPASALGTSWARVEAMTGQRSIEYTAITGFQGYTFTLPYRSDITIDTTKRIVYNSRTFQITSVIIPTESRKELQIIAYEKK